MAKRKVKRRSSTRRRRRKGVSKFYGTLLRLKKLNPPQRQQAMTIANDKFIRDFSNQVKKLRRAKNLSNSLRKKLKRHSKALRKLTNNKTSLKVKRKILMQRGGLPPLLLSALSAVGNIIGGLISRV